MTKFLLIHSYSDFNKGDAAIIISTIQNLKKIYPNCKIALQSTFGAEDPFFIEEHYELRKYCDEIYPALFPQLFLKDKKGNIKYDTNSKYIALLKYSIKNFVNFISIKLSGSLIWGSEIERRSLAAMKHSDVIISKGGSFLCSNGTLREDISLIRILHPFFITKIFNKKNIVLAQSLGPFESKFSQYIFNKFVKYIDVFYLRENDSIKLLEKNNIFIPKNKIRFCPDLAFSLDSSRGKRIITVNSSKINIGMTVVDYQFKSQASFDNYVNMFNVIFLEVSKKYNVHFYIFPQVLNKHPEEGYEDLRLAKKIIQIANVNNVTLVEGNYECIDLAETYAAMDVFIATRLHSSIFSTSKNVPTINISYHGTKAEGTFKLLNCSEFVFKIEEVNPKEILNAVFQLIIDRQEISSRLECSIQQIRNNIFKTLHSLIEEV